MSWTMDAVAWSLHVDGVVALRSEIGDLRKMVEALTVKIHSSECFVGDMRRHKMNLDAQLETFQEKLSSLTDQCELMNSNVDMNRQRIEDLEMQEDVINVESHGDCFDQPPTLTDEFINVKLQDGASM